MPSKTNSKLYSRESITWTIRDIYHNNETDKFDMNCVLNFDCERVEANLNKIISTVPRFGNDTIIKDKNKSTNTNATLTNTNKTDIAITTSAAETIEHVTFATEEKPHENSTLMDNRGDGSLDTEVTTASTSVYETVSTYPNTSDKTNDTSKNDTEVNTENSTNSTETENSEEYKGPIDGKKTDSENHDVTTPKDTESENTESSDASLEKTTEVTDIVVFKDLNSTIAKDEINMSGNGNDSLTNITGKEFHKYNPEESKTVASKVMAGVLGALTAVGVCILVKYGAAKLIAYLTQNGVYRK